MSKSIKCTNCGKDVNLKEALYKDLKSDFDNNVKEEVINKTKDLHEQINTLTRLMEKYMSEAGEARAQTTELQMQLKAADKTADIKLNEKLSEEREKIDFIVQQEIELKESKINESANLKVLEKTDIINQLEKQLSIAQQRISQGLSQTQGESQELFLEEYLKKTFPLDNINEVKKGASGADVLQVVNTRTNINLGMIYYESKLTKTFNIGWIEKFKKDMRNKGVDIGVLISSARPSGVNRAVVIKGVWVCTLDEFKILSHSLRESIIKVYEALGTQENKGDKMEFLYNYLISSEFKLQVDAIIEGFSQMQIDLETEKRSMLMSWNRREKQIKKVIENTASMHGSIQGLVGPEIKNIHSLQLGD